MALIRIILIGLIIYLIMRAFVRIGEEDKPPSRRNETDMKGKSGKKISKEIGEYIDYEEIKEE
jgi:hypothetical protein